LGKNINTVNNMEYLLYVNREVGLEVNTEETKYMIVAFHHNAEQILLKTVKGKGKVIPMLRAPCQVTLG
jgi:arginine repressor